MRQALADAQHGQCALCFFGRDPMVMDHDHATGIARGLLCGSCNIREGMTAPGASEVIDAYRANPPASSVSWQWPYAPRPRASKPLRKPGRPRGPERVPLTVRILAVMDERLTAAVEATGKSPQYIMDEALSEYLTRLGF
jgi:hypothetical protein